MCVRTTFQRFGTEMGPRGVVLERNIEPRVRQFAPGTGAIRRAHSHTDVDIGGKPHITTAPRLAPDRDTRQAVDRYSEARPQSPPRCGWRPPPGRGRRQRAARPPLTSPPTMVRTTGTRRGWGRPAAPPTATRSEEHTSELQSPYVISYAAFCL